MKIVASDFGERQVIQSYKAGGFRVSGVAYSQSLLVFPETSILWSVSHIDRINESDFKPLCDRASQLDICIFGCGERMLPLPSLLKDLLKKANISGESMNTAAACRTYNLLAVEGRSVAAALICL